MVDALVALRFASPLPRGRGVALAGAGGGERARERRDRERRSRAAAPLLGGPGGADEAPAARGSIFTNPVDAPNLATPEAIGSALRILGRAPEIDVILYHLGFHPISRWGYGRFASAAFLEPLVSSIAEVREATGKPILMALRPPLELEGMKEFLGAEKALVAAGVPVFHSLRAAARAISRVVPWAEARARSRSPSRSA
jgi:acyl-CoA synthetase (NDP forming)